MDYPLNISKGYSRLEEAVDLLDKRNHAICIPPSRQDQVRVRGTVDHLCGLLKLKFERNQPHILYRLIRLGK